MGKLAMASLFALAAASAGACKSAAVEQGLGGVAMTCDTCGGGRPYGAVAAHLTIIGGPLATLIPLPAHRCDRHVLRLGGMRGRIPAG